MRRSMWTGSEVGRIVVAASHDVIKRQPQGKPQGIGQRILLGGRNEIAQVDVQHRVLDARTQGDELPVAFCEVLIEIATSDSENSIVIVLNATSEIDFAQLLAQDAARSCLP